MMALTCRLGLCVRPDMPRIEGVVMHAQSRYLVDPASGEVMGTQAQPIGIVCNDGYVRLGKRRSYPEQYAHRIICEAVHGPLGASFEVDHLNGNRSDNRACNLERVTHAENCRRAVASGRVAIGEAKANARLTDDLVRAIRRSRRPTRAWARELGLDPATVRQAR